MLAAVLSDFLSLLSEPLGGRSGVTEAHCPPYVASLDIR